MRSELLPRHARDDESKIISVSESGTTPGSTPKAKATGRVPQSRRWLWLVLLLFLLGGVAVAPISNGIRQVQHNAWLQQGRQIGQALFSYSTDNTQNHGAYPDGNSSTEVFQKLLDGNYVSDPRIFYLPLPGKTPAQTGQKLKPENVCFDYTAGTDAGPSDDLVPLIFVTGYKVTYAPGAAAVPIAKTYHPPFLGTFYRGNNAFILPLRETSDGTVLNFIPSDFKPDGKTYRQLTPEGSLSP